MYLQSVRDDLIRLGFIITANGAKQTKPITRTENEASNFEYIMLSNTQKVIIKDVMEYRRQYV